MPNANKLAELARQPAVERRHSQREMVDVRARVSVTSANGVTTICHGIGTNLSDRGMALHLPIEHDVGKKLRIVVLLDEVRQQLRCEGTVRYRKEQTYGIEFNDLSPAHRDLILRCAASHQRS